MLFESEGNRSSARIARDNAFNAYDSGFFGIPRPRFGVPADIRGKGEIVFVHYNGVLPLKVSRTFQASWNDVWIAINETSESERPSQQTQNGIMAALGGGSLTVSYPALEAQPFFVKASRIIAGTAESETQLVSDLAVLAEADLKENLLAQRSRMILRAATKMALSGVAKHASRNTSNNDASAALLLTGIALDIFGAVTETADTRQTFTLPAEIRLGRMFVPAGRNNIIFEALGADGRTLERKEFKDVWVPEGGRAFLHYRTAK
jgi:hypothetical protein